MYKIRTPAKIKDWMNLDSGRGFYLFMEEITTLSKGETAS